MIKLPVLFLITIIFLAGCTIKEDDNFQSQPTQATMNPVITSQPTESQNQSPEPTPSQTPSSSPTPTASSSSVDSNSIVYTNKQYGFQFSLPESWQGYSIVKSNWEGNVMDEKSTSEKSLETGPILSIRDPRWTTQTPRQDIPIMVFTISQWDSLLREEFFIGAAAIEPSELGQNDKYVFAIPARYNYAFPPGYEEVDKILQSHPLKVIN